MSRATYVITINNDTAYNNNKFRDKVKSLVI